LLIVLIHLYGAAGAASSWLIISAGSLIICPPIIHARMLPGEFGTWLVWSAAVPAALVFGLFASAKWLLPQSSVAAGGLVAAVTWVMASAVCMFAMPRTRALALTTARRVLRR
jgi:hypothetical protein